MIFFLLVPFLGHPVINIIGRIGSSVGCWIDSSFWKAILQFVNNCVSIFSFIDIFFCHESFCKLILPTGGNPTNTDCGCKRGICKGIYTPCIKIWRIRAPKHIFLCLSYQIYQKRVRLKLPTLFPFVFSVFSEFWGCENFVQCLSSNNVAHLSRPWSNGWVALSFPI